MKKSLAFLLLGLTLLAGSAVAKETPQAKPKPVPRYTIEQLLGTTLYDDASFSPDGSKILVSSNQTGVINAFAIPVGGGKPVQLTDSKVSAVNTHGYFPNDERFLYSSDQGGDEQTHLYVRSPDGGVRDLTPGDKLKANFLGWSGDGKSFFFSTNERDPSFNDVFEMTVDGYEKKLLYTNEGGFLPGEVSPDRRYIALTKSQTTTDRDVYLHDRTTGKTTLLTPGEGSETEVSNNAEDFSPDGKSLYYTTDKGSEFAYLVRYDLATGERTEVMRPDWDVVAAGFSRNGRFFQVAINNDARTEIKVFETAGMKPITLPPMAGRDVTDV
ncbi:MAG TPA: S9 family peptidase, partial [Thermoanaerobaculia bacterium]|nr:S9 family peptidase [Thermoanaerobaculia bacterium]